MTKVAIKNDNITFFGGIYHIMDVFSKLGLEKLTDHQLSLLKNSMQSVLKSRITAISPVGLPLARHLVTLYS